MDLIRGSLSFWIILNQLLNAKPPLLSLKGAEKLSLSATKEQQLNITDIGKDVLVGKSHFAKHSSIDRWRGGVHLSHDNHWCWDSENLTITHGY